MDQSAALELGRHGLEVALMVALPLLAMSLFTGILVSIFQAITSVQEMTLTFVPKLLGVGLVLLFMGSWMLTTIVSFTTTCFDHMARVGR
jgi:flagellar biosynthetic protein FliQ